MTDEPIKILVVEDEMIIGAKISLFLVELGYEVLGIIPRAEEALLLLADNPPDIALLDIQLKGPMDGVELATIMQRDYRIPVIFLTANSDGATFQRAKAAKPYAFLVKPFKKPDLQRALELTINLLENRQLTLRPEEESPTTPEGDRTYILNDRIFVRHREKMVKILFDTILYIEAERNYCRVVTKAKEYLLTMPMKSLEEKLPPEQFQRIHRSHLVNLRQVEEVDEHSVVIGEKMLPLSKSFREEFLRRIRTV
ncbi:MAG: LytTR family transcriptional regulator DNA-binding domain-containing protein [Saprospiraceae bacterium]